MVVHLCCFEKFQFGSEEILSISFHDILSIFMVNLLILPRNELIFSDNFVQCTILIICQHYSEIFRRWSFRIINNFWPKKWPIFVAKPVYPKKVLIYWANYLVKISVPVVNCQFLFETVDLLTSGNVPVICLAHLVNFNNFVCSDFVLSNIYKSHS